MRKYTVTLLLLLSIIFISCGGSENIESVFEQITPGDTVYKMDNLKSLGIKKGKKYKVEGLDKATDAIFAFYKKPGTKEAIEYEIRFYSNHDDAVNAGIPMAKERVGPNAKLKKEYATWDEGLKDARQCGGAGGGVSGGGVGAAGDHAVGSCSSPKYHEFFVYNNMVILCQGEDNIDSKNHCIDLINTLNSD